MAYFRQLYEPTSQGYAYAVVDMDRFEAAIIDPIDGQTNMYLALFDEIHAQLTTILLTRAHHGQVTVLNDLCTLTKARLVAHRQSVNTTADVDADSNTIIAVGNELIRCIETPGHSLGCVSYLWRDRIFTGDALPLNGSDISKHLAKDVGQLFDSISRKLLTLPDETLIYPGHNYGGRRVSSVAEQRECNPLFSGTTRDEFASKYRQFANSPPVRPN